MWVQFDLSNEVYFNFQVYLNKVRAAASEGDITKRALLSALIAVAMEIVPPEDCGPLAMEHVRQRGPDSVARKTPEQIKREGFELYRKHLGIKLKDNLNK